MITLYHARDIYAALEVDPNCSQAADLKCVLLRRNKQRNELFLDLQDDSAIVQAVMTKSHVPAVAWNKAVERRPGDAILVRGHVTSEFKLARLRVDTVDLITEEVPTPELGRPTARMGLGSPVTQAFISRLTKAIREILERDGQIEIATRMISSAPPPTPGVYPLRVLYDGFGAPFFIAPSPAPQLIRTLATTSYNKVFTVSRCFSQGYRDPIVSVESVIVTSAQRNVSVDAVLINFDATIRALLSRPETRRAGKAAWPRTIRRNLGRIGEEASAGVETPEIQIFETKEPSDVSMEIGRLCWPTRQGAETEFAEYVLAEGYSVGGPKAPAYSVVSINVDRLLMLLFEQPDLRRIPALNFPVFRSSSKE